jgi:hypothetical protein
MENVNARQANLSFQANKPLLIALILLIMLGSGLLAFKALKGSQVKVGSPAASVVTQQTLQEQYGLGVNLVAVTAAGGMVDLRLKITDSQKAKALLGDQANFPALRASNGVVLQAAQDIASQPIKFENGGNIFVLYPNGQNSVKSGDPVTIVFGDIQVEPIPAK